MTGICQGCNDVKKVDRRGVCLRCACSWAYNDSIRCGCGNCGENSYRYKRGMMLDSRARLYNGLWTNAACIVRLASKKLEGLL